MNLLERLAGRLGFAPRNATPLPSITASSDLWGAFSGGAAAMSEAQAFTVPAIYGVVNLLGGAVSGLPIVQYRRTGDAPERIEDDFDDLFNMQMTPRWAAPSGWEFIMQNLLLQGDGYSRILRGAGGSVAGLEPLHWCRVTPYVVPGGGRLIYAVTNDPNDGRAGTAGYEVLDQDDMLHIPGFGFDGRRGMSPLRYALRTAGSVAKATQEYSAAFFANEARPDFFYKTDQDLTPEQLERMRADIEAIHGGAGGRAHVPGILTNGLDIKAVQLPFEDLQMLSTRQFQVEEIARIYGVPPFMIGHNEKTTSWGSGVEAMGIGFVRYALRQHLTKIEAEINRKLYRTRARYCEFDTHALERADMKTLFDAFRVALGRAGEPGFMSGNEVRRALRLPRKDGSDTLASGNPAAKSAVDPLKEP